MPQSVWCKPPAFVDLAAVGLQRWLDAVEPCGAANETALLGIDERLEGYECAEFEFGGPATVVSEWPAQLQCHEGLQSLVDMCFLAGAGVGSLASGYLSDKFGRRHTLMVNVLLQAVMGEYDLCVGYLILHHDSCFIPTYKYLCKIDRFMHLHCVGLITVKQLHTYSFG